MKKTKKLYLLICLISLFALAACNSAATTDSEAETETETELVSEIDESFAGRKIVWVDSYHADYEWSAGVEAGVREALEGSGAELEIIHMDTKRNGGDEFGFQAGEDALAFIDAINPDVIIVCDDNAQKYLVVPHLVESDMPVVFCGINWDASPYGYESGNGITGMVEVELPLQIVELLSPYAQGSRIGYLTVEAPTETKIVDIYNERFFDGEINLYSVTSMEAFKEAFLQAQDEVDILFMGNNAGIDGWDEAEMIAFVQENSRIPSGTVNPWMASYSLIALAKEPEEQGQWSAEAALQILDGTSVSSIPFTTNEDGRLILNLDLAGQLDAVFTPSMLRNAEIIGGAQGTN